MATSTVHLEIPASGAYLAVARAAATGLAAQLQFTYDQIDDLRIAVDEACTQLMARRGSADVLSVDYHLDGNELCIEASVTAADVGGPLARHTFAWQILEALSDEVVEHNDGERLLLRLRKTGGSR
jgi:serine/threonine-protein kinase RsbW